MKSKILYNNIAKLNQGILFKFSYINLNYSKLTLNFVDFLYQNGFILNFIYKKNYIIVFFKFLNQKNLIQKIQVNASSRLWRWFRYKQLVNSKTIFVRKLKNFDFCLSLFYTSEGFLFYETTLFHKIGGRYICDIKI